jgi:hypothetical protein
MRSLAEMPVLQARGSSTSFRAAFDQTGACISADIPALRYQGFLVNRPVVFFLTDGVPDVTEDWLAARAGEVSWPDRKNLEWTFNPRRRDAEGPQFIIRGTAPTARNPTSNGEIRDIQSWLRLGYELQVVVEEERIGKWNWGKSSTHGGPTIRESNIRPYVPSY